MAKFTLGRKAEVRQWVKQLDEFANVSQFDRDSLIYGAKNIPGFATRVEHILERRVTPSDSDETELLVSIADDTDEDTDILLSMLAEQARKRW